MSFYSHTQGNYGARFWTVCGVTYDDPWPGYLAHLLVWLGGWSLTWTWRLARTGVQ